MPAYGHDVMLRTELPHASRVVSPVCARSRIINSASLSSTKWNWTFCRVVTWPNPREYLALASASARICGAVTIPCGILIRIIWTLSCRWPYVPRTRRNFRQASADNSPRSYFSSLSTNSSMSRSSAKDRRARPNVVSSIAAIPHLTPGTGRTRSGRTQCLSNVNHIANDEHAGQTLRRRRGSHV